MYCKTMTAPRPLPVTDEGTRGRFLFTSGRAALCTLLRALNVGPADEVIVPVYTCPAVVEPIVGLGARPVYCDIQPETFGLDPMKAADVLNVSTKAMILQHTFGIPGQLDDLLRLARERGITAIEDCCHVSSSTYCGSPLGQIGDAAFYSYARGKPFSVGGGGAAVVNSPSFCDVVAKIQSAFDRSSFFENLRLGYGDVMHRARKVARRSLPRVAATLGPRRQTQAPVDPMPLAGQLLGSNYRKHIPKLFEQRLRPVLESPGSRVVARQWAIKRYEEGFRAIGIQCFSSPKDCDVTLWRYPLFARNKVKLLAEANRCRANLSDWGSIPLSFLRQTAETADRCNFSVAKENARHLVTLSIEETRDAVEIDRNLDFICRMKRHAVL